MNIKRMVNRFTYKTPREDRLLRLLMVPARIIDALILVTTLGRYDGCFVDELLHRLLARQIARVRSRPHTVNSI